MLGNSLAKYPTAITMKHVCWFYLEAKDKFPREIYMWKCTQQKHHHFEVYNDCFSVKLNFAFTSAVKEQGESIVTKFFTSLFSHNLISTTLLCPRSLSNNSL